MNKQRRDRIDTIKESLAGLKSELETIQEEEQEAYYAMPEGLQSSERGEKAQAAADALSEAVSQLDGAIEQLEEAVS
jgi:uncharacterized coiled-coil DUF342 family protein